jgi:23S rRNA (uracil1939-C5)-methyltransferase
MRETFSGTIRDISSQGLGVVDHPDGRAFFIKGVWPGDEGEFEIESVKKQYGFAKIVKLTKLSEARTVNPCVHSGFEPGQCGGCPWLGFSYEEQLLQKQKMVSYALKRARVVEESVLQIQPILPAPEELGYRNRAQFKTNGSEIGFVSPGTKILAPIEDCLILTKKNRSTLQNLRQQLPREEWIPQRPYLWNFLEIDEELAADAVLPNQRRTFKQANDSQNSAMQAWLREKLIAEAKGQVVLELFCGSGNFTEIMSGLGFEKIIAAESDKRAINELTKRQLPHVRGLASDLFFPSGWQPLFAEGAEATILVLDPPREGFKRLAEFVQEFPNLKKIFYISCEVSHFASEMRDLKDLGWQLKEVQPIDQFPQTPHVEILAEIVNNS